MLPKYQNEAWMREQYLDLEKSTYEIADDCGASDSTIARWLPRLGIKTRSKSEAQSAARSLNDTYQNEAWLREQYHDLEKSTYEIGDECGVTPTAIGWHLNKCGIETRDPGRRSDGDVERLENEEWLRTQYVELGKSQREIADELDVDQGTVADRLNKHGISARRCGGRSDGDVGRLDDREWLREQYHDLEKSTHTIADELGVANSTVGRRLRDHGVQTRDPGRRSDGDVGRLDDREWLREQYVELGKSQREIAAECEVSRQTVKNRLERHDIDMRDPGRRSDGDVGRLDDREWLREQYVRLEMTASEIGDELGVSQNLVQDRLTGVHGIETRDAAPRTPGNVEPLKNKEWLREKYIEQGKSTCEIADDLGLDTGTVCRYLDRCGIETRNSGRHSSGNMEPLKNKEWLREQYITREKSTHTIADELGVTAASVSNHLHSNDIETRSGVTHPDHLDHRVVGDWELAIATLLTENEIEYAYEGLEIDYVVSSGESGDNETIHTYNPDFVTDDLVVEVKGADWGDLYNTDKSAERKARAAMMNYLDDREYVVVGIELPCDHHYSWDEREDLLELFE